MKEIITVFDEDLSYSKKFCNQAIKIYGKKYIFLSFKTIKELKEYVAENDINNVIIPEGCINLIDDVKSENIYILNETKKQIYREGKKIFIYKLQNLKTILSIINENIDKKNDKNGKNCEKCKVVFVYSGNTVKNKIEIVKKMAKAVSKKYKALVFDIDEFNNYKGSVGLSNIIFNYKENNLSIENMKKEIVNEKNQDIIKSVTYPEDFNVITNIDLANIVNEVKGLGYSYIFVNSDCSYVKGQYIINDCDILLLLKSNGNTENNDKFKKFLTMENQINIKKITEFDITNKDRNYVSSFIKNCFEVKNGL